jgi:hypothetical protein
LLILEKNNKKIRKYLTMSISNDFWF